jgi:hypothetical protein
MAGLQQKTLAQVNPQNPHTRKSHLDRKLAVLSRKPNSFSTTDHLKALAVYVHHR